MQHTTVKNIESTIRLFIGLGFLLILILINQGCATKAAQSSPAQVASTASAQDASKPTHLCGAILKDGHACKNRVKAEGERCHLHRGM